MDKTNVNVDATNQENDVKKKSGRRVALTTVGYILIIVFMLAVFPVILPPIFGYHTRNVETDHSGAVWEIYSVAYYKECDANALDSACYIATDAQNSTKKVDVYYATALGAGTVAVEDGSTVPAESVRGWVRAKTPFIGILTALCFSIPGIIALVLIFAIGLCCMILANKISKEVNQEVYDKKQIEKAQNAQKA